MDTAVISALIAQADTASREQIANTLAKFGEGALRFAARHNVRIHALRNSERYDDASAALRRLGVDVDGWGAPPAGLFVVEERMVFLRSKSPMTTAHEFGHALDMSLGGGVYLSATDAQIREAFRNATRFVTPYSSTAIDEYTAEAMRAWVGVNDESSFWPQVSRERLWRCDAAMHKIVREIFTKFEGG